ncbi:MAG: ADP-ribosylglycohydrolase family protein [Planctomycetes bacterium]|nr:ADP-ribosylglycohydrolase family protein [Planctomycetota bacterium]
MKHMWLYISKGDLETEKQQLIDEGKDISSVEADFEMYLKLEDEEILSIQSELQAFLDRTFALPEIGNYPYAEPSGLEEIRALRPKGPRKFSSAQSDSELLDRVTGAWIGRCAGCLLGKPVEGWHSKRLRDYLKETGQWPLNNYIRNDYPQEIRDKYNANRDGFINSVAYMPIDDDTNYTVTGLSIIKKKGFDFTPEDVANFWMSNIPLLNTCTAERVAYRNFSSLMAPPESATFRNVYREWIGAQIRADFFGYAAMGNPEYAAELAWRDASISHVKDGIYGEMWAAAMIAAAACEKDMAKVIKAGLAEIPAKSRLAEEILTVIDWHTDGIDSDTAIGRIHGKWDEKFAHHWCHTISNAAVVAMALLWGEGDFEKTLCLAVKAAFDTDCNGATAGSVIGMVLGAKALPEKWVAPMHDTLLTAVSGYHKVSITAIAKEGFELFRKNRDA